MKNSRYVPVWLGEAIVKTLGGLLLGVVTAVVLVLLSHTIWRELQEFGQDLGIRLSLQIDILERRLSDGTEQPSGQGWRYVFLDIDPLLSTSIETRGLDGSEISPSQQACVALARHQPTEYQSVLTSKHHAPVQLPEHKLSPITLECAASRPINRYLLAEVVSTLAERGAHMVILDLILAGEQDVIRPEENEALQRALWEGPVAERQMVVLYAEPAAAWLTEGDRITVVPEQSGIFTSPHVAWVHSAFVFPWPGQPLRRYPKCVKLTSGAIVPSLPYLIAMQAGMPRVSDGLCANVDISNKSGHHSNAPRIIYTLPSFDTHQDDIGGAGRNLWAAYRHIWNRCLVTNFWNVASECGTVSMYTDKIIVIGASNPSRRDRHYTPIGDLAGTEVLVNAIRSFHLYPHNRDKSFVESLIKKISTVLVCTVPWFAYYVITYWARRWCRKLSETDSGSHVPSFRFIVISWLGLPATVIATCMLAIWLSFRRDSLVPSLDVLLPVLAIGVETYVEVVQKIVHSAEAHIRMLLGLSHEEDH